jgi:hypothetical protein
LGDRLSKSTALGGVNALVQCKEGQVFAVRTVTLIRDGFSTNFSTFLLKSFGRGGWSIVEEFPNGGPFFGSKREKTFPLAPVRPCLAVNQFRGAFFDAAAVRMLE